MKLFWGTCGIPFIFQASILFFF